MPELAQLSTMFWMIFVLMDLLVVAEMIRATEVEVRQLEIGTSGTIPCDHVGDDPEVRVVQWYKSRNINAFENGDPSLASWVNGETRSLSNYNMEDTTFSLVFEKATSEDEGLYKCHVESGDLYIESNYLTRTAVYALPQKGPMITLDTAFNRINCTVEHVKPVIHPVFNFDYSHASTEKYAVQHEDGTYTTSLSCTLPQNKSVSQVDCSFSYLHYQRVRSLDLPDITTDSLVENRRTTLSPMSTSVTFAGDGCRTIDHNAIIGAGIVIGFMTVIICLMFIMLIRKRPLKPIWIRDVQNCNKAEESEENMIKPAMPV
ncbi:uncharacterized protein LOC100893560 [Strongylocentrotus purpuratus]|uniref:Ig-like domain-containing protein n=1 Tax=Strongylocentrotus purpuratus TaxID=7668 RepID=A0A7M7GG79_STRPU|nr:uncharacterized protein LOC100893560 [Strongylocentrotus purpuratus]|eukprot:XP_003726959.1 PREDICTED: uncharacterized protein LOC100893560 [Strongylocentrotus purpuratus]